MSLKTKIKLGRSNILINEAFVDIPTCPKNLELVYEISGNLNAPFIIIQGGINSSEHVASCNTNKNKGWWENIVGLDKPIDLNKFCVISISYVVFEGVTSYDQAKAISILLNNLEINYVEYFIGYSYGGMVGLAFSELYPNMVNNIITLGAASESVPQTYALRLIQQKIVEINRGTTREKESLELARQLGIITYRSSYDLNTRFDNHTNSIVSYLKKKGEDFSSVFSTEKFLSLSQSINNHKINPAKISVNKITLIGSDSDQITPPAQLTDLAKEFKIPCDVIIIDSIFGHDAYVVEIEKMTKIFKNIFSI